MKILILLTLVSVLSSCGSAPRREECRVTCLEKNVKYDDYEKSMCICEDKEDMNERFYNDVNTDIEDKAQPTI